MKSGPWNLKIKTNKACFSYPFSWWSPDLSQCLPAWLFKVPDTGRHSLSHVHCQSDWRKILGREKEHKYETLSHPPILWVFLLLHFLPWHVMLISSWIAVFKNIAGDFQHFLLFSFSLLSCLPTYQKPKLFSLSGSLVILLFPQGLQFSWRTSLCFSRSVQQGGTLSPRFLRWAAFSSWFFCPKNWQTIVPTHLPTAWGQSTAEECPVKGMGTYFQPSVTDINSVLSPREAGSIWEASFGLCTRQWKQSRRHTCAHIPGQTPNLSLTKLRTWESWRQL